MKFFEFASAAACLLLAAAIAGDARAAAAAVAIPPACEIGSYRMDDGSVLDIGPGAPGQLRWRRIDGSTGALTASAKRRWTSSYGWTERPDGHTVDIVDCGRGGIRFDQVSGRREALIERETRFESNGAELAGRLTLPPGDARVPLVVLIHGAEHSSALQDYSLQRQFASAGIGVFAYDKRGTGASGGRYTQNYLLLATDAVRAAREARRLAGARTGRVGYQGGSQGGWVAPLAAQIEPVDFVIVSFGLAVSPREEDREAIEGDLARAGFGKDAVVKALRVADATADIVESGFRSGFERLDELKREYAGQAWFAAIRGNYSGFMLGASAQDLRTQAPAMVAGIEIRYDPMPVLNNLAVPQLWLLGGQDRDAPPGQTLRRLAELKQAGRPIEYAVFADADHGMYEFETRADGERVSTRQPADYFARMRDFIIGAPSRPR
ncbi:alpha/beta hydrolase family protein [Pseudomonas sp. CGJS7]|uniref:alpha/beta hydrolase family protein n=1 Tax=Pseudomonas sp. CGJS7 TaxID=3109348 RepID=UPI003009BF45